jgi:Adenylate kinase and related kinases
MTTVVLVNGPINSGKSTLGFALSRRLPEACFVDGDDHDAPDDAPLSVRIDAALRRIEARIAGAEGQFLVVAYPLRQEDFERIRVACEGQGARLIVITLAPPLAAALADRGGRRLDPDERERIVEMYREGYHARPFSNLVLDTARLDPDQAADEAVAAILERADRT